MQHKHSLTSLVASIVTIALLVSTQAFSQDNDPTPEERAYEFRNSIFKTFGWKFGQLIGAKANDDEAAFTKHAKDLAYLATMIEEGFQIKDSLPEGSRAKANIWENFDAFSEKADNLRSNLAALSQAGAMADFDPKKFGSENCGACHRDYREKKENG